MANPPSDYDQGDMVRVSGDFQGPSGQLTDPTTVTLKVMKPNGTVTTYTFAGGQVLKDATGQYRFDIDTTGGPAGLWEYRWIVTGAVQAEEPGRFIVRRANVP